MSAEGKHSETPWHLYESRKYADVSGVIVSNLARVRIDTPEGKANARLIVSAVNEREELLEALEIFASEAHHRRDMGRGMSTQELRALALADPILNQAALRKAEEEL